MGTPFARSNEAQLCPYGIITTNRKSPVISRVSVHKDVFSYERLVATSVMEAAAFSLSAVDHGLDDSAIASISFMVARSTSPTPVKWMSTPTRLCPFTVSLL